MAVVAIPIDASGGTPAYTAQQTRQAFGALTGFPTPTRPLGAHSGVRPGTPASTVAMSGAGLTTWTVGAHSGVLDTESPIAAGPYFYATDGADTGTITAADPANTRIDVLWVSVNDTVQDGSGSRGGVIGYSSGVASGTPLAPLPGVTSGATAGTPNVPARAVVLGQINVPKATTGSPSVTWVAPYTSAAGAPVVVRSQAERDALTAYDGLQVYRMDTNRYETYNGASWDTAPLTGRHGVVANFSQSFTTDSSSTSSATNWSWSGDTDNYSGGAASTTTVPITIPAGLGGTHSLTLSCQQTGTAATGRSFWQIQIGGAMTPANLRTVYRVPIPVGENDATVSCKIPLSAGQTVSVGFWFVNGGSTKALSGALSCYRDGD